MPPTWPPQGAAALSDTGQAKKGGGEPAPPSPARFVPASPREVFSPPPDRREQRGLGRSPGPAPACAGHEGTLTSVT